MQPSNNAYARIRLNGREFHPPKRWQEISFKITYENGDVQGTITQDRFEFILDAYTFIANIVDNGGIFKSIAFDYDIYDSNGSENIFSGFLDLNDEDSFDRNDTRGFIRAKVEESDSLINFNDRLAAINYEFLYNQGVITDADFVDVDYVVVKLDYVLEAFVQAIMLYLLFTQLISSIRIVADSVAEVIAITSAGATGGIASAALAVSNAILNTAFAVAILLEIVNLGTSLFEAFVQPQRTHKAMSLLRLLEIVCRYLGYTFETSYNFLDNIIYLPSNNNTDSYDGRTAFLSRPGTIALGYPNSTDYGYECEDMFSFVREFLNGRYKVEPPNSGGSLGKVSFHSELSPSWEVGTPIELESVLEETKKYNTSDCISSISLGMAVDPKDVWTIENFKGTEYQVLTQPTNITNPKRERITGSFQSQLPVALGNRKDRLNGFETVLSEVFNTIDSVINSIAGLFGVSNASNLSGSVDGKIGVLKVSDNNHSLPKLLWMENGRIPPDHRDKLSAKKRWDWGYKDKSFLANNFKRQRNIFRGKEFPFGKREFELAKLSNRARYLGRNAGILSLNWSPVLDRAIVDFYIEEKYVEDLEEIFIEPE
ncbi:MAG: hypothetical protein AAF740_01795 [Bacteroidota bacterium]